MAPGESPHRLHIYEVEDQVRPEEDKVDRGFTGSHKGHIDKPGGLQSEHITDHHGREGPVFLQVKSVCSHSKKYPGKDTQVRKAGHNPLEKQFTPGFRCLQVLRPFIVCHEYDKNTDDIHQCANRPHNNAKSIVSFHPSISFYPLLKAARTREALEQKRIESNSRHRLLTGSYHLIHSFHSLLDQLPERFFLIIT